MAPLYELTSVKKAFRWETKHHEAFEKAKQQLTETILSNPLDGEELVIHTDASDLGIGAVLHVVRDGREWPVEFHSTCLKGAQLRWTTREKEAYAIYWAVCKKLKGYLSGGRAVVIKTDHKGLLNLSDDQTTKITRWAIELAAYNLEIVHTSGERNVVADYLSRYAFVEPVHDNMVWAVNSTPVENTKETEELRKRGVLRMVDNDLVGYGKLYIQDPNERLQRIESTHIEFGHPGRRKTVDLIRRFYYWPGLAENVDRYIQSCLPCQQTRIGREMSCGLRKSHGCYQVLEHVAMDIWGPIKVGDRTVKFLTMIDHATRFARIAELKDNSGESITSAFFSEWVTLFGVPKKLLSDNEMCNRNLVLNETLRRCGCLRRFSTVYHPDGNAIIERFHKSLNEQLRKQNLVWATWEVAWEKIKFSVFLYNSMIHDSTGESPAMLMFGKETIPMEIEDEKKCHGGRPLPRLQLLDDMRKVAQEQDKLRRNAAVEKINKRRRVDNISIGDLVLVKLTPMESQRYKKISEKLRPLYSVPRRVTKREGNRIIWAARSMFPQADISRVKKFATPVTPLQDKLVQDAFLRDEQLPKTEMHIDVIPDGLNVRGSSFRGGESLGIDGDEPIPLEERQHWGIAGRRYRIRRKPTIPDPGAWKYREVEKLKPY